MAVVRIPSQLGPMLRDARLRQRLTQADVARQLGVTVQALSRLELNADRASFDRIHRLCLLLGLEIDLVPKATGVADNPPGVEW